MKSLRTTIAKELKAEGIKNICSYGLRWEKGERLQINDACFFRAKFCIYNDKNAKNGEKLREGKIVELAASLEHARHYAIENDINIKHVRKWVDYIITRSPFKDCFKTKNLQAAWRYGVQMDVKKPIGQVVSALIALRESWEFNHIANVFNLLTKNGINENVAFLLSRMAYLKEGKLTQTGFGGHQSIGSDALESLKFFIKMGLDAVDEPLENNPTEYKIYRSTRSDFNYNGKKVQEMLFEGGVRERAWYSPSVSKKLFIENAKKIEKELLE